MSSQTSDVADLSSIGWQETIEQAEEQIVNRYHSLFFEKAEEKQEDGKSSESQAYRLLGDTCTMHIHEDDHNNPFGPNIVTSNGRSAIIEDFSEDDIESLDSILDKIEDAEFKARVGDIIWTTQRDHEAAETAFEAYLESADNLLDPVSWSPSFRRIERAFQIAAMLQNGDLREEGRDFVINILDDLDGEDAKFMTYNLLKLLSEHDIGDLDDLSQRAEEAAKYAEEQDNLRKAKKLWLLRADLDSSRGADNTATDSKIRAAEAIVTQGENVQQGSHSAAAYHFMEAVEVFRRAGASEQAEETHKRLLEAQEKSVDEMGKFKQTVDLSDTAQKSRNAVSDKDLLEAVKSLALITTPPEKETLEDITEQILEKSTVSTIMPTTIIDDEGKFVATQDSLIGSSDEEHVLEAETIKHSLRQYQLEVRGHIEPAREEILREHQVTRRNFAEVCSYTPFVPPGREMIFAQGLYRGLTGDFSSACHLLVPQIEHTLRYILQTKGEITSSLQSDGIQEEYTLNKLLGMDEIEDALGEDIVFTLNSLLNSKFGANFRHKLAHGMLDSNEFNSAPSVYIWWMVLHLVFRPIISAEIIEEEYEE